MALQVVADIDAVAVGLRRRLSSDDGSGRSGALEMCVYAPGQLNVCGRRPPATPGRRAYSRPLRGTDHHDQALAEG